MVINVPMNTNRGIRLSELNYDVYSKKTAISLNNISSSQNSRTEVNNSSAVKTQRNIGSGMSLKKGQKVPLSADGNIHKINVGLGWNAVSQLCDIDASAFLLGENGKVLGDNWFVFYGQTKSPDNSVIHSVSQNDDNEIISINLDTIDPDIQKIVFVITINEALEKGLNFSMVSDAYIRLLDTQTGTELFCFQLTEYYQNVTSMVVGELYKHKGQWKLAAIGDGVSKDLAGLCGMYGVNVTA